MQALSEIIERTKLKVSVWPVFSEIAARRLQVLLYHPQESLCQLQFCVTVVR